MDPQKEARNRLETLSEQEWNAFKSLCHGLSYGQIAIQMRLTKSAIQEYLARAYVKLGLDRVDNHRKRLQAIKFVYRPLVDEIGDWPGNKPHTVKRPTTIVTYTPRVLAMVINDEIDDDHDEDEKEESDSTEQSDLVEFRGLVTYTGAGGLVPYSSKPEKRPLRRLWFALGALVILVVLVGLGWLTNRLKLWSFTSASTPVAEKTVEVTKLVTVVATVIQTVEVSTTPLPIQTPEVVQVPITVTHDIPYTVTVLIPADTPVATTQLATNTIGSTPVPTGSPSAEPVAIAFSDPAQPGTLAGIWQWSPGGSTDSRYRLSADGMTVTLISGARTNWYGNEYTAPFVTYPVSDSAHISVRLTFDPHERYQAAGLALRSKSKSNTWIALRRYSDGYGGQFVEVLQMQDGNGQQVVTINYAKPVVYLRINRLEDRYTFDISENGRNWLTLKTAYVFLMPVPLEAALHVYSTSDNGIEAAFSNMGVSSPVTAQVPQWQGDVAFADPTSTSELDPVWGYNSGGSVSNDMRVANGQLFLIAGPHTENYTGRRTAPFVYIPITGIFTAQVKLEFDPHERFQVAGIGLRTHDEPANAILIHRWSDGYGGQGVGAQRVLDGVTSLGDGTFSGKVIYLRIHRDDPQVTLSYSPDGRTWNDLQTNYVMGFPEPVTIMLYVWSSSDNGIQATFSDLHITR